MTRLQAITLVGALAVAGCATQDVTHSCQETQAVVTSPVVAIAPPDIAVLVTALRVGSYVCGTPQYAAARDKVLAWVRSKTP